MSTRRRHTTHRVFSVPVVALLLLFSFLFMITTAQAQWLDPPPTPSPTSTTLSPTPSPSTLDPDLVADITPEVSLVGDILASDVQEELENDQALLDFLMQWEWHRLLAHENETSSTESGSSSSTGSSRSSSRSTDGTAVDHTIPTSFLMCAEGGRLGVEEMLRNLPSVPAPTPTAATTRQAADGSTTTTTSSSTPTGAAAPALPFFAQNNLTCYVVQGTAADVLNKTQSVEPVKYSTPIPASLKLARGLFTRMSNGALMVNADACNAGIRVILAPGKDSDAEAAAAFIASVQDDLVTGAYHDILMATFAFANRTFVAEAADIASNSTAAAALRMVDAAAASVKTPVEMMDSMEEEEKEKEATTVDITTSTTSRLRRQGKFLRKGRELVNVVTSTTTKQATTTTTTTRAEKWWKKMAPVLQGEVICDWSPVTLTAHLPFLRLENYCGMVPSPAASTANASACLTVLVAFLASRPEVLFLEAFPVIRPFDAVAGSVMQSGLKNDTPVWNSGLDGSGQIIQVADTGLDFTHCMFNDPTGNIVPTTWDVGTFDLSRRKVVQYVRWTDALDPAGGHGTHVSGLAAGRCINTTATLTSNNINYQGIAYNAKIAFYDGGNAAGALSFPASMRSKLFAPGYKTGARVYTNSWGSNSNGYTYMDSEFDGFMYENPEALVIAAAGNSGSSGMNTVFSPSLSKNAISVGASQSLRNTGFSVDNVAAFSSRGPSRDGRIKPDIVAPGSVLISANASSGLAASSCSFVGKQGTSMATPVVSSAAALIRQYFMEGRYPTGVKVAADAFVPTGALVKSMIINSAVPMARYLLLPSGSITLGLPPDNYQGFGRIKLEDVLNLAPLNPISLYVKDAVPLAEGEVHTYKFSIPSTATGAAVTPFKVTLTWTDPYVLATAAKLVLHDLDLSLRTSKADVLFYANELTSGPDSLNSVEKIAMYTPTAGDVYTVVVNGTSISTAPVQNYALVASGLSFIPAAWYCQDPSAGRVDESYRTEYCKLTCTGAEFTTTPICCASHAGATCDSTDAGALSSLCEAAAQLAGCVPGQVPPPPSLAPSAPPQAPATVTAAPATATTTTTSPTRAPSRLPTKTPSKAPSRTPTRSPSKAPTKSPSTTRAPSRAPTKAPPTPLPMNTSVLDAGEDPSNVDVTAGAVASESFSRWGLVLCVCMSVYLILL